MLIVSFLLTVTLLLSYIVFRTFEAQLKVRKRIDAFVNIEKTEGKVEPIKLVLLDKFGILKNTIVNIKGRTDGYFSKKISSKKEELFEKKLLQAGNPFGMTIVDFHMLKISLRIIMPVLFYAYGGLIGLAIWGSSVLAAIGEGLSVFMPDYYINLKIRKRYKQALKELPDFLDLLTVSLEAGLGFDIALSKVVSKRNGILSSEFHTCLEEMRLGKTRKEALTGVKERLEFDELRSLINSVLQAEKLGISIVQILRIKSEEERDKRKQRAEEEAMKAPIKILFPLVLFIFPSIFIVILGPIVIQFIAVFSGN